MHYITSVIIDRTFVSDLDLQRWSDGLLHEAVEVLQHRGVTMLCSIVTCCLTKLWKREREEEGIGGRRGEGRESEGWEGSEGEREEGGGRGGRVKDGREVREGGKRSEGGREGGREEK